MSYLVNPYMVTASGFDPDSVSGLGAWYDANDTTTITKTGGNLVTNWADKKGSADLVQVSADAPLWVSADQNGKDIINFASSKDMDTASLSAIAQPQTWYWALTAPASDGTTRRPFLSGSQQCFTSGSSNSWGLYAGEEPKITEDLGTSFQIWRIVYNSTDSYWYVNGVVKMDGVDVGTGSAGSLNVSGAYSDWANNKVGEILRYDATVSSGDNTLIMDYLDTKWGL